MTKPYPKPEVTKAKISLIDMLWLAFFFILTLIFCSAALYYWDYLVALGKWSQVSGYAIAGYLIIFVISILAAGTVFIPVPGIILVFTFGSITNPMFVGLAAGTGEAVGSMIIYYTGHSGKTLLGLSGGRFYSRFSGWLNEHGNWAVFINSALLNPLFYPFAAMAGMTKFGAGRFFGLAIAGKTTKNFLVASAGYLGLRSIFRLIGIPV